MTAREESGVFAGIDIGGTKIAYGLFDRNKKLFAEMKSDSNAALKPELFFGNLICDLVSLLKTKDLRLNDLRGVGIGIPSHIYYKKGYIVKTGSLPLIKEFPLSEYLHQRLGKDMQIVIDNDGHAGALAEYRYGVGRKYESFVYCPVSTGISSAIIFRGEIFRGSYGWSGESGHMLTVAAKREKVICGCNNPGCFNSYCSGKMAVTRIQKLIDAGRDTMLVELAGGRDKITCEHINTAYELGDSLAHDAVEMMAEYMGMWLYNIYMLLNINCFVFSGGLLFMGDKLFGKVRKIFNAYNNNEYEVFFHEAELGAYSGLTGAMELLFQ